MTASTMRPASSANAASAITCGLIACCTAIWSGRRLTTVSCPTARYRLASALAAPSKPAALAPGRSRTPAYSPVLNAAAPALVANAGVSKTLGSEYTGPLGTTWSSKATMAVTRKVSGTGWARSGALLMAPRIPSRRSVLPGTRCSRAASWLSTMASRLSAGSNSVPAMTRTRSAVARGAVS